MGWKVLSFCQTITLLDLNISVVANVYGGAITYGGVDTVHCGQVTAYEKLTVARYWQFKVVLQNMFCKLNYFFFDYD